MAGHLVVGQLVLAVGAQLLQGERIGRVARDDAGEDLLAVALVRYADDLDVRDLRVGVEELLDLARVDVLAARMIMSLMRPTIST